MADNLYLPLDLQTKQAEMQRKQKLAQALLGAVQAPQAQMVGGQYISPGILGQALPLIKAMMGQKLESDAASEQSKFLSENAARIGTMGQPSDLIKQKHLDTNSVQAYAQGGGDKALQRAAPRVAKKYTGATRYANDGKTIQAEVQYPDGTTGWETKNAGININTGDKMYDSTALSSHEKRVAALQDLRAKSMDSLGLVNKLKEVAPKVAADGTFTGPTSDFQTQAAAFVQEFTGQKFEGSAATEYINKLTNEGLAQLIAGATGRQLTDADVKRLATQYAGNFTTPQSFKIFVEDMERVAQKGLAEYETAVQYYRDMSQLPGPDGKLGKTMLGIIQIPVAGSSLLDQPLSDSAKKELGLIEPPVPEPGAEKAPVDKLKLPPGVRWE